MLQHVGEHDGVGVARAVGQREQRPDQPLGARDRRGGRGAARQDHPAQPLELQPVQVPQQAAVGAPHVHHLRVPVGKVGRERLRHGTEARVVPLLLAAAGSGARILVFRQPGVVGIVVRLAHRVSA